MLVCSRGVGFWYCSVVCRKFRCSLLAPGVLLWQFRHSVMDVMRRCGGCDRSEKG
ncbi:hypothetical protein A2U01_0062796, partial [Trifolium medium]|nr:hypothetical protein [Trifolium medium]